jgi:hypothetical protein
MKNFLQAGVIGLILLITGVSNGNCRNSTHGDEQLEHLSVGFMLESKSDSELTKESNSAKLPDIDHLPIIELLFEH